MNYFPFMCFNGQLAEMKLTSLTKTEKVAKQLLYCHHQTPLK